MTIASRFALALALAACGGGRHGDTYAKATDMQQQCCEHLASEQRDQCLKQIVRVGDPEVARTATNQTQYACVQDHFVCDPATGRATRDSAQAQMDCLQDLP
ncbi:MAG TPA: hypothetical protein VLX92_26950 [Kofleriaceae bacterium]|nr:hypothetical protein [Kofleriaceae bacterium]